MKILAIETSCDETAVALLDIREDGPSTIVTILGNALLSQTATHQPLGGVVPSLAKREHSKNLVPLLQAVLKEAGVFKTSKSSSFNQERFLGINKLLEREPELFKALEKFLPAIKKPELDAIAVTYGPGLEPALWVGINFAKTISEIWEIPLVPINHMEGHIFSSLLIKESEKKLILEEPIFPLLSLLISGGHTELIQTNNWLSHKIIGETRDDAVGEAFDKVARMLGLPYPGGPEISKLAERARKRKNSSKIFKLPRPMIHSDNFDFSFAGLKTAVLYTLKKISSITPEIKENMAKEFEDAVTEVLVAKLRSVLEETGAKSVAIGGGVSANKHIREEVNMFIGREFPEVKLFIPTPDFTTDNAVMIGLAAYIRFKSNKMSVGEIIAQGNLRLA